MARTKPGRHINVPDDEPVAFDLEFNATERRVERLRRTIARRQPSLHLVLENVHDPHNVGAVLRTCDAVGVGMVHLVYTDEVLPKGFGKPSTGVWKWIERRDYPSIESCYAHLRSLGIAIYATDLNPNRPSTNLYELDLTVPIALVFGNEHRGITEEASSLADGNMFIPMEGLVQSLNISVACAVTLYEALRQRRLAGMYEQSPRTQEEIEEVLREWVGK